LKRTFLGNLISFIKIRPLPLLKKSGAPAEMGIEEEEVLIDSAWPHL
jgi:hypothetical protein